MTISVPSPVDNNHPRSAHASIGPSAQYSEKRLKLPSSVFSNFPSIIPSQQPTLSPSSLPTKMPAITPRTTPIRGTTQSISNKPSYLFCQVQIPAGNNHRSILQHQMGCKY